MVLPYTSLGLWFGFAPLSIDLLLAIGVLVTIYLLLAQAIKSFFYRRWPPSGLASAASVRPHLPLIGRS